jgi:NAD(P)-dependent dehydrogenase (short-subunit alcohol dehydrogenase family)
MTATVFGSSIGAAARRVAVVTGAARGIGRAIAEELLAMGHEVLVLDIDEPEGDYRGRVRYTRTDVADPASVRAAFEGLDRVDVLVNNAGIQRVGLTGEQPAEDWNAVIATNLTGAFLCTSAAIRLLKATRGTIVSIASGAAFVALPGRGAYSAAKAGIVGWTRVLAVELAPHGVRANVVAPGFTATGLVNQALHDGSLEESWMLERVPAGRLATPAEIAKVVAFLAGPEASYVTGQTLVADGGWTIQGVGDAPGWLGHVEQS